MSKLKAATWTPKGGGKVYFFYGRGYVRYDLRKESFDVGYPKTLKGWDLENSRWDGVDAATSLPGRRVLLANARAFSGAIYDQDAECIDVAPTNLGHMWPGIPFSFIDDVVFVPELSEGGSLLFISGARFAQYSLLRKRFETTGPQSLNRFLKEIAWPKLDALLYLPPQAGERVGRLFAVHGDEFQVFDALGHLLLGVTDLHRLRAFISTKHSLGGQLSTAEVVIDHNGPLGNPSYLEDSQTSTDSSPPSAPLTWREDDNEYSQSKFKDDVVGFVSEHGVCVAVGAGMSIVSPVVGWLGGVLCHLAWPSEAHAPTGPLPRP